MTKGLPIKIPKNNVRPPRLSVVNEPDISSADVLSIEDFKDEMWQCIEFDEEMDRYFSFLDKLSRSDLLAIVKYEVYNRVLLQRELNYDSEKNNE